MGLLLLAVLVTALLCCWWGWWRRCYGTLPPGPRAWPLLGNILELRRQERWEHKFIEWRHRYGPVFTYWLGPMPVVAVCTHSLAHKYFVGDADTFANRVERPRLLRLVRDGYYGLIDTSGAVWREQRRFAIRILRDFGLGKNRMEQLMLTELESACRALDQRLDAHPTEEVDCESYTDIAAGSVIHSILCGYSFTAANRQAEFYRLKALTTKAIQLAISEWPNISLNCLPLLKVPIIGDAGLETIRTFKEIIDFLNDIVRQHAAEFDGNEDGEPTDFIHAYLKEMARLKLAGNENHYFSLDQLKNVVFDMWLAGQETSSASMTWMIAYMIRYPEIQRLMQAELDEVLGEGELARMAHRPRLPYTQAVMMEVQRCANVTGQNIPHTTARDVAVEGFMVPAGTMTVPLISVMMMDEEVFPEPERFDPRRFIDEGGQLRGVKEHIPFSIGRRQCAGEGLARMELFLFTANLFRRYAFEAGKIPPTLKKIGGNATVTQPFTCLVRRRLNA